MPKYDFKKVALLNLLFGMGVSCKFAAYFQNTENTSGQLLLKNTYFEKYLRTTASVMQRNAGFHIIMSCLNFYSEHVQ